MNLVRAELTGGGTPALRFGDHSLTLPESAYAGRPGLKAYEGKQVVLGLRPEDIEDAALVRDGAAGALSVEVDIREDMGSEVFVHFAVTGEPVATREVLEAMEEEDVAGAVHERRRHGVPFIARLERGTRAKEGERLELAVDTERLHFFDPETGLGIYKGR
jgi:multiple sugar transport system ATP-binding protein